MTILSQPGTWLLLGIFILVNVIKALTPPKKRKKSPYSQRKPSRGPKRGAESQVPKLVNSDRLFDSSQRKEGHARAGNQCEYTHTKTKQRCTNRAEEGDHFYPYSKGGATSLKNFVSACKWHNQKKSGDLWEHEKPKIESRRTNYFPRTADITVGDWRNTGLRITFKISQNEYSIEAQEIEELLKRFRAYNHQGLSTRDLQKLQKLSNPGQLCDFIWNTPNYFLKNLEGIDPVMGVWMPLRLQAATL